MKKISTLLCAILMVNFSIEAQISCAGAATISPGTTTVADVNTPGQIPNTECSESYGLTRTSGRWYVFTASVDGVATVSSDLPVNSNTDTRFHVYTGTCTTLTCLAGNDDIDKVGGIRTSEATFPVSNGTSYYIAWDNAWSTNGFDFTLSETAVNCPSSLPISENFEDTDVFFGCHSTEDVDFNGTSFKQQVVDLEGDGTDNVYLTNGSTSNAAKNDWLFSPVINIVSGNEYTVNFKFNGADGSNPANENLEVVLIDSPSSTGTVLTSLFYQTGIDLPNNDFSQAEVTATNESVTYVATTSGPYYLAFNATSAENTGSILLFEYSVSEQVLNVDEFSLDSLRFSFNTFTDHLTIQSPGIPFNRIRIYNILGQQVLSKKLSMSTESVNLSGLNDGIYVAKTQISGKEKYFKFIVR